VHTEQGDELTRAKQISKDGGAQDIPCTGGARRADQFLTLVPLPHLRSGRPSSAMEFPLYDGPIPGAIATPDREGSWIREDGKYLVRDVTRPTLRVFPAAPDVATGAGIVVCPGGGYAFLNMRQGGTEICARFAELGITAALLKYRLPSDATMTRKELGPLQDARRALAVMRARAREWSVDPARIGMAGLSAGGHLAACVGTGIAPTGDAAVDAPPAFQVLVFPVISFRDDIAHLGSRSALLGPSPSSAQIDAWSAELQAGPRTPPTWLTHAQDDTAVVIENSLRFQAALERHRVPCAMRRYERGGHGFGVVNPTSGVRWMEEAAAWVRRGWPARA
jgi:acetyl esterase/lipase